MSFTELLTSLQLLQNRINSMLFGDSRTNTGLIYQDIGPLTIDITIATDVAECAIECSICLSLFELNQPADMVICGHYFHKECYQEWKYTCHINHKIITCPICRG